MRKHFNNSIIILSLISLLGCGSSELNKAKELIDSKKYQEAITLLNIEIEKNPKNAEVYYYKGYCLYLEGKENLANDSFKKASLLNRKFNKRIGEFYYSQLLIDYQREESIAGDYYQKQLEIAKSYYPDGQEDFASDLFDYVKDFAKTSTYVRDVIWLLDEVVGVSKNLKKDVSDFCIEQASLNIEKGFNEEGLLYVDEFVKLNPDKKDKVAHFYK